MIRHYAQAIASEYGWCMVRAEDLGLAPASLAHIKQLKSEIDQGIRRFWKRAFATARSRRRISR